MDSFYNFSQGNKVSPVINLDIIKMFVSFQIKGTFHVIHKTSEKKTTFKLLIYLEEIWDDGDRGNNLIFGSSQLPD